EGARALQPGVHVLVSPLPAVLRQVGRIGEARRVLADRLAEHAPQVRADAVGAALVDSVASGTFGKHGLARRGIAAGEQRRERRALVGRAFLDHPFDRKAHRLGTVWLVALEIHAADDGQAKGNDTGKEGPAGDGVEAIGHRWRVLARVRVWA